MVRDPQLFAVEVTRKPTVTSAINVVMLICIPSQHCIRRGARPDCISLDEATPVVPRQLLSRRHARLAKQAAEWHAQTRKPTPKADVI